VTGLVWGQRPMITRGVCRVFLQPQDGGCVIKLSLQASFDLLFFLLQDKYITIKVGVA